MTVLRWDKTEVSRGGGRRWWMQEDGSQMSWKNDCEMSWRLECKGLRFAANSECKISCMKEKLYVYHTNNNTKCYSLPCSQQSRREVGQTDNKICSRTDNRCYVLILLSLEQDCTFNYFSETSRLPADRIDFSSFLVSKVHYNIVF